MKKMCEMQGRTIEQRKIAREIWRLRSRQKRARKSWLDCDVRINALQHQLIKRVRKKKTDGTLESKSKQKI